MEITHKAQFVPQLITQNTANIQGNGYHTILFDNFGAQDAKIFFSYSSTEFYLLKAGECIVLGGRDPKIDLADVFSVQFEESTDAKMNILKERIMTKSKPVISV